MRDTYYYVQRLKVRELDSSYLKRPDLPRSHISAYIEHDYMGSSEFEHGAIPASWIYLLDDRKANRTYKDLRLGVIPRSEYQGWRDLYFLCRESDMEAVRSNLIRMCTNKSIQYKEWIDLDEALFQPEKPEQSLWMGVDYYVDSSFPMNLQPVVFGVHRGELLLVLMTMIARYRFLNDIEENNEVFDKVYWPHKDKLVPFTISGDMTGASGIPLFSLKYYNKKTFIHPDYAVRAHIVNDEELTLIVGQDYIDSIFKSFGKD